MSSEDAARQDALAESIASDMSPGEGAAVLREVARLQLENKTLKARMLRVWSAVVVLSGVFGFTVFAFTQWYPKYRYIPTSDNRAVCEVTPEKNSRVTPAALADFTREAVVSSYSYDYINYRETLNAVVAKYFTNEGRRAFLASLDTSGNLERVIKGRLILRSMSTKVPQIEEEGLTGLNQQKYWIVQVPIAIEFYSGGDQQPKSRQDFLASATVVQENASATNLKGLAIDSITLAPYTARR